MAWGSPSDIDPLPPPYSPHIGHFVRSKRGDNPKSEVFVKKFLGKIFSNSVYLFYMKRIIRLTESDLTNIIKKVISESEKAPSLQKVYNKIYKVLSDMGYSKFQGEFNISYGQDNIFAKYPAPARNYGKYVGTYEFQIAFYLEDDVNIKMIAKKIMDELNNEFGNEFFKLGNLYKEHFLIKFNKLALGGV